MTRPPPLYALPVVCNRVLCNFRRSQSVEREAERRALAVRAALAPHPARERTLYERIIQSTCMSARMQLYGPRFILFLC